MVSRLTGEMFERNKKIIELVESGVPRREVAIIFSMSTQNVHRIIQKGPGVVKPLKLETHGTYSSYRYGGCKCELCLEANREQHSKYLEGREAPNHGTYSGYCNYRCRCDPCKKAAVEYRKARYTKGK